MAQQAMCVIEPVDFAREAYWRLIRTYNEQKRTQD